MRPVIIIWRGQGYDGLTIYSVAESLSDGHHFNSGHTQLQQINQKDSLYVLLLMYPHKWILSPEV